MIFRLPPFGWGAVPQRKRLLAFAILIVPLGLLSGCGGGILQPQGPIGGANAIILLDAVGIMSAIVVPTLIAVAICAWWFRASNTRARYRPDFVYSGRIEIIVWSIPILVIMFLGGVIWIGAHELDPFEPLEPQTKPTEVDVVSLDWKWLFIYPDEGIASVNALTVPAGVPVHFRLTSATVMNAFFIPQLGSMIATMDGMVTQLYLQADHPGDFYGESAQYSGDGFSDMHFVLHAVPADAFNQWVAGARAFGPTLDRAGYLALLQESQNNKPFTYRSVEPKLFDAIVRQQLPQGPGPQKGSGGPQVRPIGDR
ncbi:MAG TPA: ubiquinol oxidase subunit II [Xanthobacteraceae bacterium]|nr:ubiquinol oxidase subunit II [Xanthobacteraceae bacterium]